MAACYDSTPQPVDVCGTFTRAAADTADYPAGTVTSAITTTFNAGVVRYEGEFYVVDYQLPLENVLGGGFLGLTLDATHNARFETSVTGTTFVRSDNTVAQPDWVSRLTGRWGFGRWLLSYQMYYLSDVKSAPNATIENTPTPDIDSNMTHSMSLSWNVSDMFTLRAGVNNFTDEEPSYPTIAYGDILGRRWFLGATARF